MHRFACGGGLLHGLFAGLHDVAILAAYGFGRLSKFLQAAGALVDIPLQVRKAIGRVEQSCRQFFDSDASLSCLAAHFIHRCLALTLVSPLLLHGRRQSFKLLLSSSHIDRDGHHATGCGLQSGLSFRKHLINFGRLQFQALNLLSTVVDLRNQFRVFSGRHITKLRR